MMMMIIIIIIITIIIFSISNCSVSKSLGILDTEGLIHD